MWNYNWQRPEKGDGQEGAVAEQVSLNISGLPDEVLSVNLRQISENYGNPRPRTTSTPSSLDCFKQ